MSTSAKRRTDSGVLFSVPRICMPTPSSEHARARFVDPLRRSRVRCGLVFTWMETSRK